MGLRVRIFRTAVNQRRLCTAAVIAVCVFLVFWRLDSVTLFRDEADTALLAERMVTQRDWIPRYFDGQQLITHMPGGEDFDERFVPVIPGWLQFYVEALSFKAFGTSTWTARMPFAALGLAALGVLYWNGALLLGRARAWIPPLLAVTSIFSLTMFREARYYALVYLFASLLILEFSRYVRDRRLSNQTTFYVRLGIWGLLLDLSHWGSFAATWFALSVFAVFSRDAVLRRKWIALSAIMIAPIGAEFAVLHLGYLLNRAGLQSDYWGWRQIIKLNALAVSSIVPLVLLVPPGICLWKHRTRLDRGQSAALLLSLCVIVLSVLFTIVAAHARAESRYYIQILPAAVLLESSVLGMLVDSDRRVAAVLLGLGFVIWPNLSFNIDWSEELVERQLLARTTYNEPLIAFLQRHVRGGDTLEVVPNHQGQAIHFCIPQARWVGQLDSNSASNQRYRQVLPAAAFDDYPRVDWLVVWHSIWFEQPRVPLAASQYHLVWRYRFTHPHSFWDALRRRFGGRVGLRVDGFDVWESDALWHRDDLEQ
jgi:hypothetical protein